VADAALAEGALRQCLTFWAQPADEQHLISGFMQGRADANHPLVEGGIGSDGKDNAAGTAHLCGMQV